MGIEVEMTWPGGRHKFALYLGQLRTLQDACNAGPEEILNRLRSGTWRVDDVVEPLRLGLIGSGAMAPERAGPTVLNLIKQGEPLVEFKLPAMGVLTAALMGVENDPLGEAPTEEAPTPTATG